MNDNGFLRLYRRLLDWEWFDNSQMVHLWIYFLLKANYQDGKWHGIEVPRGSFLTSLDNICKDTGLTVQNVRTCINKLKSTSEITIKVTNKYSIITVCKYDLYNVQELEANKQDNKQANIQLTSNQQATNKQKEEKEKIPPITPLIKEKEDEEEEKERKEIKKELSNESKKKEGNSSELSQLFDKFRVRYKQYGGKARGLETELENLKKKHKDWKEIIPLLSGALEKENAERQNAKAAGKFFPEIKNLQTYINQRSWEAFSDGGQASYDDDEYRPLSDGVYQRWNPTRKCLEVGSPYPSMWNDGYNENNRPDGATVAWSLQTWKWSRQKKEWIRIDD